MKKTINILVIASLIFVFGTVTPLRSRDTSREIKVKQLALMINDTLRRPALKNKEIGIMSFSNLNNLEEVEPLGRLLQERLAHEMFKLGYRIIEIRLRKSIYYETTKGELNLTRLSEELKRSEFQEIQSLIVGTYIDAGDYIYVNSRFVELETSMVKASGEIKIKKGKYLDKLLRGQTENESTNTEVFERFPTKKNNLIP